MDPISASVKPSSCKTVPGMINCRGYWRTISAKCRLVSSLLRTNLMAILVTVFSMSFQSKNESVYSSQSFFSTGVETRTVFNESSQDKSCFQILSARSFNFRRTHLYFENLSSTFLIRPYACDFTNASSASPKVCSMHSSYSDKARNNCVSSSERE